MTIVDAAIVTAADDRRASDAAIDATTSNPAAIEAATAATVEPTTKATAATKPAAATTYGLRNGLSRSRCPTMRYCKRAGLNSREHWRREQRGTHGEGQQ